METIRGSWKVMVTDLPFYILWWWWCLHLRPDQNSPCLLRPKCFPRRQEWGRLAGSFGEQQIPEKASVPAGYHWKDHCNHPYIWQMEKLRPEYILWGHFEHLSFFDSYLPKFTQQRSTRIRITAPFPDSSGEGRGKVKNPAGPNLGAGRQATIS